ncbi:calcium-transporting ATPase 11 [Pyrus ussuriensis x Pyrus communis]|uniref:Calcium-transporting ATPase 11 n=1 Tax=Pyrus ussuriensis x Pyrus communis TaxID=2448454 RepID=A0A5N5H4J0_9ROSA|nr:calcium-transporting ATPase 11 [Pyrus ussuriensis x Pyrus communis]
MEKFLKDFEVENKNPSEEAIRRWRNAVALVKNRRRRFRFVANLAKRSEAEKKKLQIQPIGGSVLLIKTDKTSLIASLTFLIQSSSLY